MWRLTPAVKRDDADDFGIAEPGACALYAKLGASLSGRRVTRQNRTPDGMAIFFTSDTHFGHGGALGLYRRPFASVAAVNEAIIERWNEIVGPDDEVWHLGDFAIRQRPAVVAKIFARLHGRKHLVTGNNAAGYDRARRM